MSKVFVVQSAQGHYFSKQGLWISGKDANLVYVGQYKDEALNQLIDITLKDVTVRARVIETELNQRKLPALNIMVETDLMTDETGEDDTANLSTLAAHLMAAS